VLQGEVKMLEIWRACQEAKPLALGFGGEYGKPSEEIQQLAISIKSFLRTWEDLQNISKRREIPITKNAAFSQTLDECRDFDYDYEELHKKSRSFGKREHKPEYPKLEYRLPRYVYTDADISRFREKVNSQLNVLFQYTIEKPMNSNYAINKLSETLTRKRIIILNDDITGSQESSFLHSESASIAAKLLETKPLY
jgi:hypothetical protein